MPMPSVNDLQTMYGSWNPQAYLEAQSNASLERQFRESEYARQQELAKKASLDNLFQEQDDPNKIKERVLTNQGKELNNTGLGFDNTNKRLDTERKQASQQWNLDADQRKAMMAVTEDQIKAGELQGQKMASSLDPAERKQGEEILGFSKQFRDEKRKHEYEMSKEKFKEGQTTGRFVEGHQNALELERIRQQGQTERATARGSNITSVALTLNKLSPDKRLGAVKAILDSGVDPDTKAELSPAARAFYESMYQQDVRTVDSKPAPGGGVVLEMGPDGKPKLGAAPVRPSVAGPAANAASSQFKLPPGVTIKSP